MSTSGALLIVCCTESTTSPLLSPSRHFNTTNPSTSILKIGGSCVTEQAISSIYYADQAAPLGMIIVLGHTGCTLASGDVESSIATSVQALTNSPYIRKGIPIMGYVIDLYAQTLGGANTDARLREVSMSNTSVSASSASTSTSASASGQQHRSNHAEDLSPFWS